MAAQKNLIEETKNEEKVPSLQTAEVVLVQFNLVDNQYWQNSTKVLYTFTLNQSHAYLFNVEPNNLVFLKTSNTEFDEIITTFTVQNGNRRLS